MRDPGFSYVCLSQLKELGITLALDQFASSALSLNSLRQLPIDELKIDRQFIHNIEYDAEQFSFTQTIVSLAKGLGKSGCMTGVENDAQLKAVHSLAVDAVQGYLLAEPMASAQLDHFISQSQHFDKLLQISSS